MSTPPGKLVLIDGSSYLYRAFHALPPLSNSKGEPTGAVLGVINMLQKILKEENPELIAVVFDAPGRTFRDELFEEYKANRPPMPDELRSQIQPLLDAVVALGMPLLRISGVEADDVIGTLARRAAVDGLNVLISTGDKDMAQLVDERITLVNTMTGTLLDRAGVKAKFDVFPEQIVDYLALVGDSSDNIPGVPKVGPKTAAKWLGEFGTIEGLLANAGAISGKVGESLRENLSQLELSRKLATIDCSLTLEQSPAELLLRTADAAALRELYGRLELRLLLKQLGDDVGEGGAANAMAGATSAAAAPVATPQKPNGHYSTVSTEDALAAWLARLRPDAALLYRLNADRNPLHADPKVAARAGFERPILHGLATYGIACRTVLKTVCNYQPDAVRKFDARFSAPVYPGDELVTEIWKNGDHVAFRAHVPARGTIVLNNGRCSLSEPR